MAEPSTTSIAANTAFSMVLVGLFSGVDIATLIGAVAGASLFVLSQKDLSLSLRLAYLIIGVSMGYLSGPASLGHLINEPAAAAFFFAVGIITLGHKVIDAVDKFDLHKWMRRK